MLAEGAPDSVTADYLHGLCEPTARAIAGLERVLEAVGLLSEALALDLRRPQAYFGRVGATAFRAQELAQAEAGGGRVTAGPASTEAAIAARRRQSEHKTAVVEEAIGQLRRERGRLTVRANVGRVGVSATSVTRTQPHGP